MVKSLQRRLLLLMLAGYLAGCAAFNRPNVPATLNAENGGYRQEMTALALAIQAEGTRSAQESSATMGALADLANINQQLMATARAVIPRTATPVYPSNVPPGGTPVAGSSANLPVSTANGDSLVNGSRFVDTAMAASVRQSDGCAGQLQTEFPSDATRIYATTRALRISGGSQMSIEWKFNGQTAVSDQFTVALDGEGLCLWFFLDGTTRKLSAGFWTARLFINGQPIDPELSFTIMSG